MEFNIGHICTNGHPAQVSGEDYCDNFCTLCGAEVIHACPHCGSFIKGHPARHYGTYYAPAYCYNCGKPYPWTETAIQATIDILAEDTQIPDADRAKLVEVLPDAVSETPRTQLAAVRIGKAFKSLGSFTAEALRQFLIEFGCTVLKSTLGLP